jgi:chorismate mutase
MEFSTQDMKRMSQIAKKMEGKSEDQVVRELAEMIKAGQGGLTPQKAEQMFQMIMPMLTNEQKQKISKLLNELRD